ncbi:MAG: XrtA/PEP-CTERM system histidine kinase PrsK [Pseudomonadota bacterium]
MNAGAVSYGLAAASCFIFLILLLTRWRGRLDQSFLPLVIGVNALWALWLSLAYEYTDLAPLRWVALADTVRGLLWIVLLWRLLTQREDQDTAPSSPPHLRRTLIGVSVAALTAHGVGWVSTLVARAPVSALMIMIGCGFIVALCVLVYVEQLYRNSGSDVRWTLKFLCLGIGGMFAYDIYLFASGLLFLQLNADLWAARGAINALAIPLMAVSIRRCAALKRRRYVSRRVVFYSSALLGVGMYLIIMATGGYMVRAYGGTWGGFAQILFLSGALVVLVVVLFSGQARARVKVFLTKHFMDFRYDYREEWLKLTRALTATDNEKPLAVRAIEAVTGLLDAPGGALWIRDGNTYTVSHVWNLSLANEAVVPVDSAFLSFMEQREWVIDLHQLKDDPAHYDDLAVPPWLARIETAWVVLPLKQSDGLVGFMVLAGALAPRELSFEDHDLLKTVGRQIAGHLALDRSAQMLTETRQFQAYNRLTAFIMHDLKNLIAQQSLVVKNAARHKDKPEFVDDAIATVDNSVQRMNRLLEQLRTGESQRGAQTSRIDDICGDVVRRNAQRQPVPELNIKDAGLRVDAPAETLTMVLGHLVRNAQDATPADGSVTLIVGRERESVMITIRDNGSGMNKEFIRDRLFRPFDTTKGTKGMGIGVYQARDFLRSVGGQLTVQSEVGQGSTFVARLPISARSTGPAPGAGVSDAAVEEVN